MNCHQHRPDQQIIPKGLSFLLSLSTKAAKFHITRSNASDQRKHYPRLSTIYTLVWIHNKIGVRPCDILCPFHFSFSSPCPIPGPLFYPIITPLRKTSLSHSIPSPSLFFVRNISHYLFTYIHTPRDGYKKTLHYPPPPSTGKKQFSK